MLSDTQPRIRIRQVSDENQVTDSQHRARVISDLRVTSLVELEDVGEYWCQIRLLNGTLLTKSNVLTVYSEREYKSMDASSCSTDHKWSVEMVQCADVHITSETPTQGQGTTATSSVHPTSTLQYAVSSTKNTVTDLTSTSNISHFSSVKWLPSSTAMPIKSSSTTSHASTSITTSDMQTKVRVTQTSKLLTSIPIPSINAPGPFSTFSSTSTTTIAHSSTINFLALYAGVGVTAVIVLLALVLLIGIAAMYYRCTPKSTQVGGMCLIIPACMIVHKESFT